MISKTLFRQFQGVITQSKYYFSYDETSLLKSKIGGAKPGEIISRRGQLLYYASDPYFRQSSLLKFGRGLATVAAILDNTSIAVALKNDPDALKLIDPNTNKIYTKSKDIKIDDLSVSKDDGQEIDLHVQHFKNHRSCAGRQLFTGNIYRDLFQPLCYGQFLVSNSISILQNLADQFDEIVIYSPKLTNLNVTQFLEEKNLGSQYFLPKVALFRAQQLALEKKRVLLVYDGLTEHARAYNQVMDAIQELMLSKQPLKVKQPLIPPILGDLSYVCGYREGESDMTVLVIQREENEDDAIEYQLNRELKSLSSLPIEDQKVHSPSPLNLSYQSPLLYMCASRLYDIFTVYEEQKKSYIERSKLRIHIEPWDYYLFLDGKVWVEMLNILSKTPHQEVDLVVLSWWICRIVEQDKTGYLKNEPQLILDSLLYFIRNIPEFEQQDFKTYYNEKKHLMRNGMEFAVFITESINRLIELHFIQLKMNDLLFTIKKDHIAE